MQTTFYTFIKRYVDYDADDPMSRLANTISKDMAFPKQSQDFDEISTYMEQSGAYGRLMTVFDEAWLKYTNI
ncbi:sterile alpha motif-like domain-containing protein [Fundicoccus culcitae]|uniref:Sterile alpha motif-like domain-containing protein n=1 Tax=Fundicoccus culcitae TaxID=2969821 RepID=A0ABY5P6R1_9LACT|nr:sterile alpha motif-like domain-containing protein [Fundicoccus culcitae]UUX34422.1 sterile alpha motif-like domain-containing protein [Fundicoccus culcitae]